MLYNSIWIIIIGVLAILDNISHKNILDYDNYAMNVQQQQQNIRSDVFNLGRVKYM